MDRQKFIKTVKAAFPYTVPVMMGYVFLGAAFGVLLAQNGYGLPWAAGSSLLIYAGSMQFVCIELLNMPFSVVQTVMMTLMVNARHIFYGISMLERYKSVKKRRPYLIFGLTDETYCVLCSTNPPEGADRDLFFFLVTFLNQVYWVVGSVIGTAAGSLIAFNAEGIDFAMTALFIVMLVNQWEENKNHAPALIGLGITVLCLVIFGTEKFLIFSMIGILVCLMAARPFMEKGEEKGAKE